MSCRILANAHVKRGQWILKLTNSLNVAQNNWHDNIVHTGKSLSETLIFTSTNPQYEDKLFIELHVQYMKIPSSNLGRTRYVQKLFSTFRTIFVHNMFSPCSAERRASDKDLPVTVALQIEGYHRHPKV